MERMPISKPLRIDADSGVVIVEGEPGVVLAMTPDVALAASDDLMDSAALAIGQAKTAPRSVAGAPSDPADDAD